ncbi:protein pbn1 [Rhizodiscina lignyota]|uniref:Protein PBN1 n=1 Tax=Rhizodiscina lignyota TaxID=1504668 RepID=A0A9P4M2X1_9PEZI|nr:protein pbn1 [Rhizodiscina lignyota]
MKQRLTYILKDASTFDPSQLKVTKDSIEVTGLDAAKEQHLTFGFDELPPKIWRVLKQCHELHIRWAAPVPYNAISPFLSRVSSGLHVFFTPRRETPANLLCPMLRNFDETLKCESPEKTFVPQRVLSERFSTSSSFSYYTPTKSLDSLESYIFVQFCDILDLHCQEDVYQLGSARYVDIDFDVISNTLIIRAYWEPSHKPGGWTEITRLQKGSTLEVGVLNNEKPDEPEELKLGGFLTVVGSDSKPKATLFSFPARYHPLPNVSSTREIEYKVAFRQPTGMHPIMEINLEPKSLLAPSESCALHTYLTLPSYIFIDKYQFNDDLFLASQNLRRLHSINGETDLEAPDWVIDKWGSNALFELALPSTPAELSARWTVTIPLHLRYLKPAHNSSGIDAVRVPWPAVFWACEAEEGLKMSTSPFDRVNLGYDSLFGPKTMFYPIPPGTAGWWNPLVETLSVPVLDLDRSSWVEFGTIAAISLGTLWICWKLFAAVMGGDKGKASRGKKRQ